MGTVIATIAFGVALAFLIGYCKATKEGTVQMPKETKSVKKVAKKAAPKKAPVAKKAVVKKTTKKAK